jgi:hypothetical protein
MRRMRPPNPELEKSDFDSFSSHLSHQNLTKISPTIDET